ncbi:fibrinogen alpha chain-like [Thrips palmi]|uniref:Fibrinogen alpha chain-like n=1 Tax=Thrips palmi TaxID=161013 RepID=A0A6P8Y1K2_THRPL|nr:fibrinogen alpha chain-like [Thrips palmi]
MELVLLGCVLAALGVPGTPAPLATVTTVLDASNDALDFRPSKPVGAEGDIDLATLSSGTPASETGLTQRARQEAVVRVTQRARQKAVVREQAAESLGTSSARPLTPRAPTKLRVSTSWRPNRSTSGPWAPATSGPVTWAPRTSRPSTWAPRRSTTGSWVPGGSGGSGGSDSGSWVPGGSGGSGGSDSGDSDWGWHSDTGSSSSGPFDANALIITMGILLLAFCFFVAIKCAIDFPRGRICS